jgi:hypothetical protein
VPSAVAKPQPAEPEPEPERVPEPAPTVPPVDHYDDLEAEEVISLLGSLEPGDLVALRDYERAHAERPSVVGAIESVLARRGLPHVG